MSAARAIGPDTVVVRSDDPVAVEVDHTVVMMSIDQGMYYGLEGPGPRIWALLDRPRSARQLRDQLVQEFDVDAEQCLRDVCDFLAELGEARLIRIHDGPAEPVAPPSGT